MKRNYKPSEKRALRFALLSILLLSCNKDVEVEDSFGFEIKKTYKPDGFVLEAMESDFVVIPEHTVKTTTYGFSYSGNGLDGYFEGSTGEHYEAGKVYEVPSLEFGLKFMPKEVGTHNISLTVQDNKGNSSSTELKYNVARSPFSFILSTTDGSYIVNSEKDISFTLSRTQGANLGDPFRVSYYLDGGTGSLHTQKAEKDMTIEEDSLFLVENGTFRFPYLPLTLGAHTVHATAIAPDGESRSSQVSFEVGHLPFNWSVTSESNQVDVGQESKLSLNLINNDPEAKIGYEYFLEYGPETVGKVEFSQTEGEPIAMGKWSPITIGNHDYTLKSYDTGRKNLRFKLRDSNGQEKMDSVLIDVQTVPLVFKGSPESTKIYLNQKTRFNFELTPKGSPKDITYVLQFDRTTGDGILYQDGKALEPAFPYTVTPGSFTYEFTPTSLDKHEILFVVTDSNGQEVETTIKVNSQHVMLNFNASPSRSTMLVNSTNKLTLGLIENDPYEGMSYEISYFITGGTGTLSKNGVVVPPSEYFAFGKGSSSFDFVPEAEGNYVITFLLRDSNGQLLERKVPIRVDPTDFQFTATQGQNTIALGTSVGINLAIVANNSENVSTYEMTFESDGNGSLKYGGNTYAPGQTVPLSGTAMTVVYFPTSTGTHTLEFTVRDSNGVVRTDGASVTVNNGTFSFSSAVSPSKVLINETANINMNLAQDVTNPLATYSMSYEMTGSGATILDESGNEVQAGIFVPINPGNFSWSFTSGTSGAYGLEFTVRDNVGMEAVDNIVLEVGGNSFDLTANAVDNTGNIGQKLGINMNIQEAVNGTGDTYVLRFASDQSGKMTFDGTEYTAGQSIPVPSGDFQMEYIGNSSGTHNVVLTVTSSNNTSSSKELALTFQKIDFSMNVAPQDNIIDEGGTTALNFDISDTNGGIGYEMRYVVSQGNAIIMNGSGGSLSSGTYYPVSKGSFSWTFKSVGEGIVKMEFFVRNSTGTEKSRSVQLEVLGKTFSFGAVPQGGTFNINEGANVTFNIGESGLGGDTYTLYYSTDNDGVLTLGGSSIAPGATVPINVGNSTATYTGFQGGDHNLVFSVTSSSGEKKTSSAKIPFVANNYSFAATGHKATANLTESVGITFNISELIPGNDVYTATYSNSNNGDFIYNGKTIAPGQGFVIDPGNTTATYKASVEGSHKLNFIVRSSGNIEKNDDVTIVFNKNVFTFSATEQSPSANVGQSVGISLNIGESVPGIDSYTATYSNTGSGTLVYKGQTVAPGQSFNITPGLSMASYKGSSSGSHKLTFNVSNTFGQNRSESATISFNKNVFTFSATEQSPSVNVGQPVGITLNIGESVPGIDSYTATYSNTGSGSLIYGGQTIMPGQSFSVLPGSSTATYTGSSLGNHQLNFVVSNLFGQTVSKGLSINVMDSFELNIDFNENAYEISNQFSDPLLLFVDIMEGFSSNSYTISYTADNLIIKHPSPSGFDLFYNENQQYDIDPGQTTFELAPSLPGILDTQLSGIGSITVTIRNDNGFSVDKTISIPLTHTKEFKVDYDFEFSNQGPIVSTPCIIGSYNSATVTGNYVLNPTGYKSDKISFIQFRVSPGSAITSLNRTTLLTPSGNISVFVLHSEQNLRRNFSTPCDGSSSDTPAKQAANRIKFQKPEYNYLLSGGAFQVNVLFNDSTSSGWIVIPGNNHY